MVWEYRQVSAYVIFLNKCEIRVWVVGWNARDVPSLSVQILSFSCTFRQKMSNNRLPHLLRGWCSPWEILALPLFLQNLFSARNFSSQIDMGLAVGANGAFRRYVGGAVAHDTAPSGRVLLRLHPWREHRRGDVFPWDPGWAHRCGAPSRGLLSVWGNGVRGPSGWNITRDFRGTICIHR